MHVSHRMSDNGGHLTMTHMTMTISDFCNNKLDQMREGGGLIFALSGKVDFKHK